MKKFRIIKRPQVLSAAKYVDIRINRIKNLILARVHVKLDWRTRKLFKLFEIYVYYFQIKEILEQILERQNFSGDNVKIGDQEYYTMKIISSAIEECSDNLLERHHISLALH